MAKTAEDFQEIVARILGTRDSALSPYLAYEETQRALRMMFRAYDEQHTRDRKDEPIGYHSVRIAEKLASTLGTQPDLAPSQKLRAVLIGLLHDYLEDSPPALKLYRKIAEVQASGSGQPQEYALRQKLKQTQEKLAGDIRYQFPSDGAVIARGVWETTIEPPQRRYEKINPSRYSPEKLAGMLPESILAKMADSFDNTERSLIDIRNGHFIPQGMAPEHAEQRLRRSYSVSKRLEEVVSRMALSLAERAADTTQIDTASGASGGKSAQAFADAGAHLRQDFIEVARQYRAAIRAEAAARKLDLFADTQDDPYLVLEKPSDPNACRVASGMAFDR